MSERTLEDALRHARLARSKNQDQFRHAEEAVRVGDDPNPCCCWCALFDIQLLADEVKRLGDAQNDERKAA